MAEIDDRLRAALPDIARRMENELTLVVPVDTGRLKGSIKVKAIEGGIEIFMAEHGKYVEFGTPPHLIRPKNKQALRWKGKDKKFAFAKVVKHPGTRPNPFVRNTIQTKIRKIIMEEIS